MTGIATAAVGLVPGYDMIGIWGAVILTLLRLIQGIGVGGEWGGSVLLAMEWASTNKNRGFIAAWPQFGAPAGLFLANLAVLIFSWISGDEFLTWGWRIPFLLSVVMVGVGLWTRYPRNSDVPPSDRGKPRGTRPDDRGVSPPA
jgi:MFS family permease